MKIKYEDKKIKLLPYDVVDFMRTKGYGICVYLYEKDDEPYGPITKNFGELIGTVNSAYLDTNNYPGIVEYLVSIGAGTLSSFKKCSGFCEYPLFTFNEEWLKNIDEFIYDKYRSKWNELMSVHEDDEICQEDKG